MDLSIGDKSDKDNDDALNVSDTNNDDLDDKANDSGENLLDKINVFKNMYDSLVMMKKKL